MCIVASKLGDNSIGSNNNPTDSVPIFNCTSGSLNPITWGDIKDKMIEGVKRYPYEQMLWFPSITYQTNPW
jgi:alcohol-forming fatty acyl-CoA reductase